MTTNKAAVYVIELKVNGYFTIHLTLRGLPNPFKVYIRESKITFLRANFEWSHSMFSYFT